MSYSPPPGFVFVHETRYGTAWFMRSNGPYRDPDWLQVQDTEAVLDRNQALANHNGGWSIDGRQKTDKLLRRVATVPWAVITDWKENKGIDYFSTDPDMQRKVDQMLDSSDWSKLRTAHFRIGKQSQWV
jgi:hypothetical protein